MKAIKKISIKTVVGNQTQIKELAKEGNGAAVPIMRVGGIANSFEKGTSNYGEWIALKGDFQAVCIHTGEVFRAPSAFLPEAYTNAVVSQLMDDNISAVEVGVDVNAHQDESSVTEYQYSTTLLMPPKEDPISKMFQALPPVEDVVPRIEMDNSKASDSEPSTPKKKAKKK